MIFQNFSASVRSFRILGLASLMALLCAAPLARAATPASSHIYLYDDLIGFTDVTATFDGESVVSAWGDVVYVAFGTLNGDGTVSFATSAGQHTTDFATSAGQHTTDFATSAGQHTTDFATSAGQHTTDIVVNGDTSKIVGIVTR